MGKTYKRNRDGDSKVRKVRRAAQDRKAARRLQERSTEQRTEQHSERDE